MNKGNPYAKLYALLKVKLCLQACVKNEPVLKEDIQENISLQSPTQGTHEKMSTRIMNITANMKNELPLSVHTHLVMHFNTNKCAELHSQESQ